MKHAASMPAMCSSPRFRHGGSSPKEGSSPKSLSPRTVYHVGQLYLAGKRGNMSQSSLVWDKGDTSDDDIDINDIDDLPPSGYMAMSPERKFIDALEGDLASKSIMEALASVLSMVKDGDLETLRKVRDSIDAKCQENEGSSQNGASVDKWNQLLDVPVVDDGGKVLCGNETFEDWKIGRVLGSGRYATVFSAKHSQTSRTGALKMILKKDLGTGEDLVNLCNEHNSLREVGTHPNIASLTGALESQHCIYFFLDFVAGKELFEFIKIRQQNRKPVPNDAIVQISSSVALALTHCHKLGICHRDLKPENIVVQQDYTANLVDFGCACPCLDLQGQCVGSMPFIAPECLCGTAKDGAPADVWSLGVVILEMMFGLNALSRSLGWNTIDTPTDECGTQLLELLADPISGLTQVRTSLGVTTSPCEEEKVIAQLLHADPLQRPSAEALCKSLNKKSS